MKRLLAVALAMASIGIALVTAPGANAAKTNSSALNVWNINLHWQCWDGDPQIADEALFFDQLETKNYLPDIVLAQEVPGGHQQCDTADDFMAALNDLDANTTYASRHATVWDASANNGQGAWSSVGGRLVAWRTDRFNLTDDLAPNTLRFRLYQNISGACALEEPYFGSSREIAVRLWDELKQRKVVAASIHAGNDFSGQCLSKGLKRMDEQFEENWSTRRLTIVGGDFNHTPERNTVVNETSTQRAVWRSETDTQCWHEAMSEDPATGCTDSEYVYAGGYTDTVRGRHWGRDDDQNGQNDICEHWTHGNVRYSAFDANSTFAFDRCDNASEELESGRIDYIWVRYENSSGDPVSISPRDTIDIAVADRGWVNGFGEEPRYSDHRAVNAFFDTEPTLAP